MVEEKINQGTTIINVANYFLKIVDRDSGAAITPLKLQKLLYYAQAWSLVFNNKRMFEADFYAWAHGPANPEIYKEYDKYGYGSIDEVSEESYEFSPEDQEVLSKVWDWYGRYDGKFLENIAFAERPWQEAREKCEADGINDVIISEDTMKEFYTQIYKEMLRE